MSGIIARSRAIRRSRKETPVVDNYTTYFQRIEEAQESMRIKLNQNRCRVSFLSVHLNTEDDSRIEWERRVAAVEASLDCYNGAHEGYSALAGMLETARSMHAMFTARCEAHSEVISQLKAQEAPLIAHINQLTAAKAKLQSAHSLEQARGNMEQILASRNSSVHHAVNSAKEDQELRSIRQLIAESEALVELKG